MKISTMLAINALTFFVLFGISLIRSESMYNILPLLFLLIAVFYTVMSRRLRKEGD